MSDVYLWKVGDRVVYHTDLQAAKQLDGLSRQPDKTVTEEQFSAADGLTRIINGKIFLGKTDEEITAKENEEKVIVLKRKLADTDYIAVKIAEGAATIADYADKIAERRAWRQEINELEG